MHSPRLPRISRLLRAGSRLALICALLPGALRAAVTQFAAHDAQGNLLTQTSSAAQIAPTITRQSAGKLAQVGGSVSVSVLATGSTTLTFQWKLNTTAILTAANPSAATSTLVLNNLTADQFGDYSVTVTNGAGSVTSAAAALQLDSVGDGIPDSYKAANFGASWAANPLAAASADFDGDGYTNAEEYADGTNPNLASSHFYHLTVTGNAVVSPAAARYAPGTVVTVTALPQSEQQFSSFSTLDTLAGNGVTVASSANPLTLTLNTSYAVTVVYSSQPLDASAILPSFTRNNHDSRIEAFLVQADGKLVVGGNFQAVAGVEQRRGGYRRLQQPQRIGQPHAAVAKRPRLRMGRRGPAGRDQ